MKFNVRKFFNPVCIHSILYSKMKNPGINKNPDMTTFCPEDNISSHEVF
jgi:hypothetical protein